MTSDSRGRKYELYIGRRPLPRLGVQTIASAAASSALPQNRKPEAWAGRYGNYPSCSWYSLMARAAMANARLATGTPA